MRHIRTINTHARHRLFQRTANAELLIATLVRYREQARFLLHAFVIMPNHLHVLLTPTESTAKAVQLIKGGFSFAIRDQFQGEVWHTGHHEHRIRDASDYATQLAYIANNPLRKNYADYPHIHTHYPDKLDPPSPFS